MAPSSPPEAATRVCPLAEHATDDQLSVGALVIVQFAPRLVETNIEEPHATRVDPLVDAATAVRFASETVVVIPLLPQFVDT
jgi:hypothetical protein